MMNARKTINHFLLSVAILSGLTGCFQPAIYLQNKPHYLVDVFYENQRPERPFDPIQDLEIKSELPLVDRQSGHNRMLSRGNDMQQKELLLARLTMQAKKLGADALVAVKYTYFTSTSDNGYVMTGLAVKYRKEMETATN